MIDRYWSMAFAVPRVPGRIDPNNFTPYPRNPLLANFFVNIGRADLLGSGVRNLYQLTKIYSGGEPELIDGDVFRTIIPLNSSSGLMSDKVSDKVSDKMHRKVILTYLAEHGEIDTATTAKITERSPGTARRILSKLRQRGHSGSYWCQQEQKV